eukprot:m.1151088 g.1151088  ORF g.1151088 m.1151088 type:complete len:80 (+) comp24479_c0_seq15:3134-3373(+)
MIASFPCMGAQWATEIVLPCCTAEEGNVCKSSAFPGAVIHGAWHRKQSYESAGELAENKLHLNLYCVHGAPCQKVSDVH